MRVRICGVRGSRPAAGHAFAGIGGNTSCVAIAHDGDAPSLVIDAGTGLSQLSGVLGEAPFRGTIVLGHLHWDHTGGLPFFAAGDREDAVVRLLVPEQGVDAEELLGRAMSPPHFPITPSELHGDWTFGTIDEGAHQIEGFEVLAREIPHKGGRTFGYRVTDRNGRSMAYLSDHAPQAFGPGEHGIGETHESALALAADVDLLIHDAQYTRAELATRYLYGHSAADYGAQLAEQAGASRVLLYHHDPNRNDGDVAEIARGVTERHPGVRVDAAIEGMEIDL